MNFSLRLLTLCCQHQRNRLPPDYRRFQTGEEIAAEIAFHARAGWRSDYFLPTFFENFGGGTFCPSGRLKTRGLGLTPGSSGASAGRGYGRAFFSRGLLIAPRVNDPFAVDLRLLRVWHCLTLVFARWHFGRERMSRVANGGGEGDGWV